MAANANTTPSVNISPHSVTKNKFHNMRVNVNESFDNQTDRKKINLLYQEPIMPFQMVKNEKQKELKRRQWDQAGAQV